MSKPLRSERRGAERSFLFGRYQVAEGHRRVVRSHPLRLERLESRQMLNGDPLITELMARNRTTLLDEDGESSDWFEIHNPTQDPISLPGYTVTDDPEILEKWALPGITVAPGSYLVVFASGKDRVSDNLNILVTRDFNSTPDGTFLVDLPNGTYDVQLQMGDFDAVRDNMVIRIQGIVVETVSTQIGEIFENTYPAQVDGGQLAIHFEDVGGQTGRAVINGLVITPTGGGDPVRFDFGTSDSPLRAGYTAVTIADTYGAAAGYGWAAGAILSQEDRGGIGGEQHTNFKLGGDGEYLALVSPEGVVVSEYGPNGSDYPEQFTDISYGILGTTPGSEAHYLGNPTPGSANDGDSIVAGFVEDTKFTFDRGFYQTPFDTEITTATPGATLVYTTDGTEPTLQNGTVVPAPDAMTPPTAPVHIDKTTVLRAAAFRNDYLPSNVDTQTYLFLDDVIEQDVQATLAAGFPSTWKGTHPVADYGMDPDVIGQSRLSDPITRDFNNTPDGTFVVDLPDGTYDVRLTMGDADRIRDNMVIHIQGMVVETVTTQAGEFFENTYTAGVDAASSGLLGIRFEDTGGQTGRAVINGLVITPTAGGDPMNFDFGTDHSPVAPNTIGIASDLYPLTGEYGWLAGATLGQQDRGATDLYGGIYAATIRDDLKAIPTVSLVLDIDDMFGPNGIYSNSLERGLAWERPVSIELLDPNSNDEFQENAGIRIVGGLSRSAEFKKKAFRLEFRDIYGPTLLEYPLFGPGAADRINSLVLRHEFNDSWAGNRVGDLPTYARDRFGSLTHKEGEHASVHDRYVHLYINGFYWGLYGLQERPDEVFFASYFGGDPEEYDVIKHCHTDPRCDQFTDAIAGTEDAWNTLISLTEDVRSAASEADKTAAFMKVLGKNPDGTDNPDWETYLDLESYLDYIILNFFLGNTDWPGNNWYTGRRRGPESTGFSFIPWDSELVLGIGQRPLDANRVEGTGAGPPPEFGAAEPFGNLRYSEEFRIQFADRVQRLFFNGGLLAVDVAADRFQQIADELDRAVVAESARWGDAYELTPRRIERDHTATREDWLGGVAYVKDVALPTRWDLTLQHMRNASVVQLFPDVDAPELMIDGVAQHGGTISVGAELTLGDPSQAVVGNSLTRDFHATVDGTFVVDLPEGTYEIQMTLGDLERVRDQMVIHVQGVQVDTLTTEAGQFVTQIYTAEVSPATGGQLGVGLEDMGGETSRAAINALVITPAAGGEVLRWDFGTTQSLVQPGYIGVRGTDTYRAEVGYGWAPGTFLNEQDRGNTIYYTLNGEDPREMGGAVSTAAAPFHPGTGPASTLDQTTLVKARMRGNSGQWSALSEALFAVATPELLITELNYNPYDPTPAEVAAGFTSNDDFEFIELENVGPTTVNLLGTRFSDGIEFTFPSMLLDAGERVVVVKNQDAFETRYGMAIHIAGEFTSSGLSNAGENLTLVGPDNITTILDFAYNDNDPWPERADGSGGTLELIDPIATPAEESGKYYHWRGSTEFGGSPGTAGSEPLGVVINEVHSNTDIPIPSDSIELYNPTGSTVDIGGLYLSDSAANFLKYQIPIGTMLGAGEYVVFDESDFNPTDGTDPNDFGLNGAGGDDVWLTVPDGSGGIASFVDDVHFGAAASGESFGRTPDGSRLAPMTSLTLGAANSDPRVGPLVVSEIHYHPLDPSPADLAIDPNLIDDDLEFVEVFNPTGDPVGLTDWRIRGGVDFDFDAGTMIAPGEALVVISFNPDAPANVNRLAAFRSHFGMDNSVRLLGGYANQLNKNGEKIKLERPDDPTGMPLFIPRLLEDEVLYDDLNPWPTEADGTGKSLTRISATAYGNLSASWTAGDPIPGSASFLLLGDMDLDDDVDCDDIDDFVLGLSDPVAYEILFGVPATVHGDTDQDGDLDFDDIDDFLLLLNCGGGPQAVRALNADGQVTDGDVGQLALGNEAKNGLQATIHGDTDRDGDIDFDDIDDFLASLNAHAKVTDTLHVASASSASSATGSTRRESPTHDSVWSDPTDWLTRIIHEANTLARSAS